MIGLAALAASLLPASSLLRANDAIVWASDTWIGPATQSQENARTVDDFAVEDAAEEAPAASLASFQPQPLLVPQLPSQLATPTPAAAESAYRSLFGTTGVPRSFLVRERVIPFGADVVLGSESQVRATTDTGNLLGESPSVLGVGTQRRNPIVTDPRVRGSRVGALAASGSYWVPARIDLDTALSKIDSRIIDHTTVIKGPYSALYGPGFSFFDVELLPAPRMDGPFRTYGQTSADYKTNGEQWYGRQSFWGGNSEGGFRVGYGHRTGSDYRTGGGRLIPSSYKSREWDVAFGRDLSPQDHVDFHYLRLDQTDLELPGQAFDIDFLVTDGFDLILRAEETRWADSLELRSWYNQTRFEGSAQRPGKRAQFPFFNAILFEGSTDVESMSTGYRAAASWQSSSGAQLIAGSDLRYVKQELNEITSGVIDTLIWTDANSPVPRSHWSNPGIFLEVLAPQPEGISFRLGARADWVSTNIDDDATKLAAVGPEELPYAAVVGSNQFSQDDSLWSAYAMADCRLATNATTGISFGFAQRPPNLTERYAAQPFMFLLQSGLNTVTGDPALDPERLWQLDVRFNYESRGFRSGVTGFYAWAHDYITYEAVSTVPPNVPAGLVDQVNLKYVNTDLATFTGVEAYGEWEATGWLTPFATLRYVQGTDRTRNGEFATRPAAAGTPVQPSVKVFGLPRGFFSGVPAVAEEPLPNILPLESRIGLRLHPPAFQSENRPSTASQPAYSANLEGDQLSWGVELSARIVDDQDRVAASLLETPTPGFTVWDIRAYWNPRPWLMAWGGVENFTDKDYRTHLDFRSRNGISVNQPGINFYLGGELTY